MCVNPGLSNPSGITQIENGCGETGRISGGGEKENKREVKSQRRKEENQVKTEN